MKLTCTTLFSLAMLAVFPVAPVFANPSEGLDQMWECPQADGSSVYTNKERPGCQALTLKPLSVVPDLITMPTMPRAMTDPARHHDRGSVQDRSFHGSTRTVPDWARDWYASIAPSGSVQEEVCSLYSEWMHLVQKTRGGFFFGSDPSYGGALTGRNQREPSYSYFDNARYLTLSKLFGRGFVPVHCP